MEADSVEVDADRDEEGDAPPRTLLIEQLLIESYPALISLVSRRCGKRAEAADLLHEAIRITIEHHASGRIANLQRLPGYVFRTALNLLRNHKRAIRNRPELRASESEADTVACADAVNSLSSNATAQEVRHALSGLRMQRDRVVIQRFYMDEEPKGDICRDLGISGLSFDKIAFRARQRLKELLIARSVGADDVDAGPMWDWGVQR
jgi:RNA polymerase sigma-70 factor, ECF subfamily